MAEGGEPSATNVVAVAGVRARERVLFRLRNAPKETRICGFYHPDDVIALERLQKEGRVDSWRGQGKDYGLTLARLKVAQAPPASACPARSPNPGEPA